MGTRIFQPKMFIWRRRKLKPKFGVLDLGLAFLEGDLSPTIVCKTLVGDKSPRLKARPRGWEKIRT